MAAVDVDSLTITYGKVTAVDDLSFQAEAGEVTCVLGPNGAGKTSTVEALEGLRRPLSGRLSVVGLDPHADHQALTQRIGVMLQDGGIHPAVRVREALRHAAALYRDSLDADDLIGRLGLGGLERRTYRQLSGGEQRRLALALALVGRPQVAFLDEPTTGVDPAGRQVIRQVIADLRSDGVTVVLTTHDLDEAERVADRVVIVVGGRLVAEGSIDELTRSSGSDEQVRFRGPAGLDRASLGRHLGGVAVTEVAPGDYMVDAPPTPRTVAAVTGWLADHDLPLADLRAGRQRLEDVYLRLTAGGRTPDRGGGRRPTATGVAPPSEPGEQPLPEHGGGDPASDRGRGEQHRGDGDEPGSGAKQLDDSASDDRRGEHDDRDDRRGEHDRDEPASDDRRAEQDDRPDRDPGSDDGPTDLDSYLDETRRALDTGPDDTDRGDDR